MGNLLDVRDQWPSNTIVAFLKANRGSFIWLSDSKRLLDRWIQFGAKLSQISLVRNCGI